MKKKILLVVGTRPNFIKVTQFKKIAKKYSEIDLKIVHTGQHYDKQMSAIFLEQLDIKVDFFLEIKAATSNQIIGNIILKLEKVLEKYNPDLLLCVGDVNSTLAAAITANKLNIKLGHIESGLRSYDRQMPEEINRIITDEISDLCFVTEKSGCENLIKSGKKHEQIHFVGNTMIDTLISFEQQIEESSILEKIAINKYQYFLITMHRPSNVDNKDSLIKIINLLTALTKIKTVIFPIHPRTKNNFEKYELLKSLNEIENLKLIEPQNYFSFQKLIKYSFCVITDSGGIQEETTFQKIPCITLRKNTERPSTILEGSNTLLPFEIKQIIDIIKTIENGNYKSSKVPDLWDGKSTERILDKCYNYLL